MRSAVLMAGILCVAGLIAAAQEESVDDYIGGQVCASCHPSIASTYREVGMARTFRPIADVPVIEDWTTNNRYFHEPSNQHFLMTSRDGKFYQKRYQLDDEGAEINAVNDAGQTAMHGAAKLRSTDLIRLLADNGARVDVADSEGETPLSLAGATDRYDESDTDSAAALLTELASR